DAGHRFNRHVVIAPILQYDEAAVAAVQDEIEGEIAVGHGHNRINRVGIAAAHHVAETLVDGLDRLALIVFGGTLLEFGRAHVTNSAEFQMPAWVGRPVGGNHFTSFEHCSF